MLWGDERGYKGQWKSANMHGFGKYSWKDGRKYEGQFSEDKKHGYGIYRSAEGRLYKGYWKEGLQHGLAEYQVASKTGDETPQSRFGMWHLGKRLKWFSIDRTRPIMH